SMITRWLAYLERTTRSPHPVWAPWHAFAELSEKDFAARAADLAKRFAGSEGEQRINPLVAKLFTTPPANRDDLAKRYAQLLNEIDKRWAEELEKAEKEKRPAPVRLTDDSEEELRQVFHAANAAPNIHTGLFSDLELLPDRASQGVLQDLR